MSDRAISSDRSPDTVDLGLGGLATALRVLLLLGAVVATALAYLAVRLRVALDDVDAGTGSDASARDAIDAFFGGATVFFLALLTTGILFVVWLWRLARNNQAFGRPGALGPGWAIGSWFIPLGSLVLPGLQVHQIWKGADGTVPPGDPAWRRTDANPLVWVWWGAYVVGQVLTFLGFRLLARTDDPQGEVVVADLLEHLEDVRLGITLFVAGQVLLVLAAAVGAGLVVSLSRRQETAAALLGTDPGDLPGWPGARRGRASPPAWHPDPTGRFDQRYWDGRLWTEHVMRGDEQTTDPV